MYNQAEAILSQYELEIHEVKKGRGSYICNTDKGIKAVTAFRGSNEKGLFLKKFLEQFQSAVTHLNEKQGVRCMTDASKFTETDLKDRLQIEQIMLNKNGEAVTIDEMTGESFLLKDYVTGRELDTGNAEELKAAVRLLADYQQTVQKISLEIPEKIKANATQVIDIRKRHQRELTKVKNFIRNRKKRSEFEQLFFMTYEPMQSTIQESIRILEKHPDADCILCHGEVNQHNILCEHGKWRLVNFENFTYSWRVLDMANFFRKIMEKNDWDIKLGMELIGLYQELAGLEKDEMEQLYGVLLFPEKFWKVSNHYMSSRKNWISEKDIEKLKKVVEQEEKRLYFIETLFSKYL